jgi:hypothetical protein
VRFKADRKEIDRQTDRQTDRQAGRQTDRQGDVEARETYCTCNIETVVKNS